ncbi:hypothetical protein D0T84_09320 [Dysgonomonas sp. 521]|uniref:glycan-binding surface protein n=1 Tax=Dysgonomonas sp. 521 TaxID=2302932 RepID=UPI0013D77E34|nr:glycan-binding surface protein [Dysgonomonas sp. 521]NDV95118.1 hypothetical protein [Dysgonomonas sp. 521]
MKIHINIKTILAGLFLLMLVLPFASCDNDDDGGLPVIHQVRTTDPELKDSTFVKANPGQMLLIEGENLGGVRKIYINNQDVFFNPNYVTSQTIIVVIPDELELTGENPELPKEIRVETKAGSASYTFHVLSPAPVINRLQVEYPVNPGDRMVIYGENFYEIEKIMLEGRDEEGEPTGVDVEVSQYTYVGANYKTILFALPQGAADNGEIVMYCAADKASIPYARFVQPPAITSLSSDMPIIGAEFFITGDYFIDVKKVNINGEYDILAENLRVAETKDTIYLKLPTEPTKSGKITVTAAGGDSKENKSFYPIEYVIANYDDVGSLSWAGSIFEGDGEKAPYTTTGKAAGVIESNVSAPNWWFGNVLSNIQFRDAIADSTPVSDLVVRYECFVSYPLQTISFQVMFGGDWDNMPSNYVPKSIVTGETEIGKWMTCQIPLSMIAVNATTYSDIKAMGTEMGFFAKNGDEAVAQYEVYFDNLRIVKK